MTNGGAARIRAEHAGDAVHSSTLYAIVQQRILTGHYSPGIRVRESDLQHEFGTSNGPVREALQLAAADGLVERAPFRGVRVIQLDHRQIADLFEVRGVLLTAAAELAATRATPEALARGSELRRAFAPDRQSGRRAEWLPGDLSRWVLEAAGNAQLAEAYRRPLLQSLVYVNAVLGKRGLVPVILDRYVVDLIDAIIARDPDAAKAAARILTAETLRQLDVL